MQDYSQSARNTSRATDQIFKAAVDSTPDFVGLANTARQGRGLVQRAMDDAKGYATRQGLKSVGKVQNTKNEAESAKKIADIKRPAQRMAGIVAGLSTLSTAAVLHADNKRAKQERLEDRRLRQEHWDAVDAKHDALQAKQTAWLEKMQEQMEQLNNGTSSPKEPETDPAAASVPAATDVPRPSGPSGPDPVTGPATVGPTSVKGLRGDVYNYLTQHHKLSRNKALGLMANIDRESSFRIAPAGGDGGNSFGMFQWNNTYGRSDIMKKNVKDWQTNWKGQIDHALSGNQLPEYNKVTTDFKNTTFNSAQEAADYWMKHWERPAHQGRDSRRHTEILGGYNFQIANP